MLKQEEELGKMSEDKTQIVSEEFKKIIEKNFTNTTKSCPNLIYQ